MSGGIVILLIESFFSTWALNKVFRLNPGNLLSVLIFVGCFLFYRYVRVHGRCVGGFDRPAGKLDEKGTYGTDGSLNKKAVVYSRALSVTFTMLYFLYDRDNYVAELSNELFKAFMLIAVLLGLYFFFLNVLGFLYRYLTDDAFTARLYNIKINAASRNDTDPSSDDKEGRQTNAGKHSMIGRLSAFYASHMGVCTFVLVLLFCIPYFLYQFPGIMTPDSIVQYEQALHIKPYSNHHPWVHTLILEFFYDLGYAFTRNPNISVSFYTVAQMLFIAFCASYVVTTLKKCGFKPCICMAATLFYAIVPYNNVFAITIWKDIPFAGVVALFVCVLIRMDLLFAVRSETDEELNALDASNGDNTKNAEKEIKEEEIRSGIVKLSVGYFLLSLCICLLRSNGWYAFIVLIPFLLIHFWKRSKLIMLGTIAVFALAWVIKYPVMSAFNVERPDMVESLSVPLQQVASVIVSDGNIDDDSMYEIRKVVDLTYISALYEPTFADNIKELVRAGNQDYLANNKVKFLKIYLKLGIKNPAEYLKAFVMQTYGYFYPDRDYEVADAEGVVSSSLEFTTTPLIGGPVVIKLKEIFNKLGNMIPIYSVLWSMGSVFWILLLGISVLMIRGKKSEVIYYLPYLLLMLTIFLATPVATEFRYAYFLMFSMPLVLTIFTLGNDRI